VEPVYLEAKQEESELPSTEQPQPRDSAKPRRRSVRVSSQQDKSRGAALPELKRVIVAFSNRLVMEENLDKALSISNLGVLALEHYNKAKDYLREGNWAEYGSELENLEKILEKMSSITKEKK
jgi:uncharacterized membrane protein (UPF0182 family)